MGHTTSPKLGSYETPKATTQIVERVVYKEKKQALNKSKDLIQRYIDLQAELAEVEELIKKDPECNKIIEALGGIKRIR